MAEIDWTLLILLVVGALGVLGLVIALQSDSGRGRLADAALALAEALLSYAVAWLEKDSSAVDVPSAAPGRDKLSRARQAQAVLRG